ncbi:MAG: hypothetical protein ACJ790_04470 [Myxococcaceae bacterium]
MPKIQGNRPATQPQRTTEVKAPASNTKPATSKPTAPTSTFEVGPAAPKKTEFSTLNFYVHSDMDEVKQYAAQQGWTKNGWTQLSIPWQELVYTTDHWKTTQVLKSFEVPSPFINGRIQIPNVPAGTEVEFAIHVGVASHAPSDIGGYRERGDVWLNNGGKNFSQVTR